MRAVNFKTVRIRNFLSIGNDPVEVDFTTGVHIITGINKDKEDRRNGVGKSAVADAIHFAVFGTTIRDIKKENIINKINKKNCHVELELDITEHEQTTSYKIVRALKPSKCWIYVDGEDRTRDSISNTNAFIQKRLKTSPDIFQNCVIMTINSTTPFLAKNKGEKRKFIESIFNLKVFSDMAELLKQEQSDIKRRSEVEFTKVNEIEGNLNTQEKQRNDYVNEEKSRAKKLTNRKQQNEGEIVRLTKQTAELKIDSSDDIKNQIGKIEAAIEKCDLKITESSKDCSTKQANKKHKRECRDKLHTDGDECEHCLRAMDDQDKEIIDDHKVALTKEIEQIESDIKLLENSVDEYSALKGKLKTGLSDLNSKLRSVAVQVGVKGANEKRIAELKKWNDDITLDETTSSTLLKTYDTAIRDLKKRLGEAQQTVKEIKDKINLMDIVKFILSEEGVKSYIVKKILQLFNSRLAYYLKRMDANCICLFNEYFEEELFDEKGRECSYFNFSGAERKNLDLACLFTFMDIRRLQGDISYNINVYDELLDSSLDEKGVNMVIDILRERVEKLDECIMIISHRKESVKAAGDKDTNGINDVIFLEKENGITRRVMYNE